MNVRMNEFYGIIVITELSENIKFDVHNSTFLFIDVHQLIIQG